MDKKIFVYDSFSSEVPILIGTLFVNNIRGNEVFSFEYDLDYLNNKEHVVSIDPEIEYIGGRQYSANGLFGVFKDACPDRWGRVLMQRREAMLAKEENRQANKLLESDYLIGVDDFTRMGGLRFKLDKDGPFIAYDKDFSVPPWTTLRSLEEASRNYEEDNADRKWLNQIIKPGSSLGGARPKANVLDVDGSLWIAKFPSKHDEIDVCAFEKVSNDLAKLCGLNVMETRLEKLSRYGSTFLVKRFDRDKDKRIHFESAMTLLNKNDGDNDISYLDIVDFIKECGSNCKNDLIELYKRIAFNIAISNSDDHLRNHGFIYERNGFKLSPLYDVNPILYSHSLSLNIDEFNNEMNFEILLSTCKQYGINQKDGVDYINQIINIINNNYEKLCKSYGINRNMIETMSPCFKKELFSI